MTAHPHQIHLEGACAVYSVIPEGMTLGSMNLNDDGDTRAVVTALLGICSKTEARAIFLGEQGWMVD